MLTGYIGWTMLIELLILQLVHLLVIQMGGYTLVEIHSVPPHINMSQYTSGPATHRRYQNWHCKYYNNFTVQ